MYNETTLLKQRNKILLEKNDYISPAKMVNLARQQGISGKVTVEYIAHNDSERFMYAYATFNGNNKRTALVIPKLWS